MRCEICSCKRQNTCVSLPVLRHCYPGVTIFHLKVQIFEEAFGKFLACSRDKWLLKPFIRLNFQESFLKPLFGMIGKHMIHIKHNSCKTLRHNTRSLYASFFVFSVLKCTLFKCFISTIKKMYFC